MAAVIDASVLAAYLIDDTAEKTVVPALSRHAGDIHIPHLCIIETTSVIRGLERGHLINEKSAALALADLAAFPAIRWPHDQLLDRIWQLRHNITAYDATYVALAEALRATLLTKDARLAGAITQQNICAVELIG